MMNKTALELQEIFARNADKRICVLGTTCCGKTSLKKEFPEAVDMDEALWPTLSKAEEAYICQKPWTSDIGRFTGELVRKRVKIEAGHPLFSLILLECDLIVYLRISDERLKRYCAERNASFEDAKKVKCAIEETVRKSSENRLTEVMFIDMCC